LNPGHRDLATHWSADDECAVSGATDDGNTGGIVGNRTLLSGGGVCRGKSDDDAKEYQHSTSIGPRASPRQPMNLTFAF